MKNPFEVRYRKIDIDGLANAAMTTEHIDFSKLELPLYGAYALYNEDTEGLQFINKYTDGCVCIVFPLVSELYYAEDNVYEKEETFKYEFGDDVYLCEIVGSTEYDLTTLINMHRIHDFMSCEFCDLENMLLSDLHWDIKTTLTPDSKFIGNDKFESRITCEDMSWIYIQTVEHVKDEDYNIICDNGLRIEIGDHTCLDEIQKFVIFIYVKDMKVYKITNFDPENFNEADLDFNNSLISNVLNEIVNVIFCLNRIPDENDESYHTDSYSSYAVQRDDGIMKYRYTTADGRVY